MKKNSPFILLFFINLIIFSCKSEKEKLAEQTAIKDSTLLHFQQKYYENQVDSVFKHYHFNGNISLYKDSTLIFEKDHGFENFETKEKLNKNDVFAIGSLSKQFTAVLILLQEEKGLLKTTDNVSKYLKSFQNPEFQNITIQQLLNHSSGISDTSDQLMFKSGFGFNYSNKGYRFLGDVIEKVSGKTYTQNASQLFLKAGMKNTFTASNFNNQHFAGAYIGTPKNAVAIDNMPERLAKDDIGIPAGGILSTSKDLQKWNVALFNGTILNPESLKKFTQKSVNRDHPIFGKVGYCDGIMTNLKAPKSYFHTGYVKGSPSLNIYYPETKTSVIILSNIADESGGIEPIFIPHNAMKNVTDNIETALQEMK